MTPIQAAPEVSAPEPRNGILRDSLIALTLSSLAGLGCAIALGLVALLLSVSVSAAPFAWEDNWRAHREVVRDPCATCAQVAALSPLRAGTAPSGSNRNHSLLGDGVATVALGAVFLLSVAGRGTRASPSAAQGIAASGHSPGTAGAEPYRADGEGILQARRVLGARSVC